MQRAYGLQVPQSLEEVCDPRRVALIVYDMQVGILGQIREGAAVTAKVAEVVRAARNAGVRIFFSRYMSLPKELIGIFQLRMAMAWQRVTAVEDVRPKVSTRHSGISTHPRDHAAPVRGGVRQDHDVGLRGNTAGHRPMRLRDQCLSHLGRRDGGRH